MADQLLSSPDGSGLDRAGWARLGAIAQATQSALAEQVPEEKSDRSRSNGLAQFGIAVWETLKRDWHRLFHPLEGLRERFANSVAGPAAYREAGAESADKAKPAQLSPLEKTWTQVRDQLFEAAKNPQADPRQVADSIVSGIPKEHRTAMVERLGWLAEMAQTTAKTLEQVEVKAQAKTETKVETKVEAKAEAKVQAQVAGETPTKTRAQRQVPPQPLPPAKPKQRPTPTTPAPAQTQTRAKAR